MSLISYRFLPGLASLGLLSSFAACGDGPTCPELVMVFQSPAEDGVLSAANDQDTGAAGIQSDVTLGSSFTRGDTAVLTITDANGAVSEVGPVPVDDEGNIVFSSVTFPAGTVTLSAVATSDIGCGTVTEEIEVAVVTEGKCDLSIAEGLLENEFFAPIPVLNSTNDSNSNLPNFQANFVVDTIAGFEVEIFVLDTTSGQEASLGTVEADGTGTANLAATLTQGRQAIRATCKSGAINEASATTTVHVDTVVPTCTISDPAMGVTVTPDDDTDNDDENGIQMVWRGQADDGNSNDAEGETVAFFRNELEFEGSDVTDGISVTNGEFTSPGTYSMAMRTQDHAGNPCNGGHDVTVIMEGCSIVINEPSVTVTADADGTGINGMQAEFQVAVGLDPVDTDCVGRNVQIDCGQGAATVEVPEGGLATTNVTLDPDDESQGEVLCTATVTNVANFATSDQREVTWDTLAPEGVINFLAPVLTCGDTVALVEANDANADLDGFQIQMSVTALEAVTRVISVTSDGGTETFNAPALGAPVFVTLESGDNDIRGIFTDASGNTFTTGPCNIGLQDIALNFDAPADDGLLGSQDGTVNGNDLETTLCVSSSDNDVTVTITIDGNDNATTFVGGSFCTGVVTLSEGDHVVSANAQSNNSTSQGSVTIDLEVDLTPPAAPGNFTIVSPNHVTIDASWNAVADATYEVRFSDAPFSTDPAIFVTQGQPAPNAIVGETTSITPLDPGETYHVGLVAIDAAGNRSAAQSAGPLTLDFTATGAIFPVDSDVPPEDWSLADDALFGQRLASGDFNGDGFEDLAVAAPANNGFLGEVYIFFGSTDGYATPGGADITPDVIIRSQAVLLLGRGLARLDWSGAGDGLAISAPINNQVFIFHNASLNVGNTGAGAPVILSEANRDILITVAVANNYFSGSTLGLDLTTGQLDAAGTPEDLIISAPLGGNDAGTRNPVNPGGRGGVVVLYGGTLNAGNTITLSEDADAADLLGLAGHIFENPVVLNNDNSDFGHAVNYLGDTRTGGGVGDFAVSYRDNQSSPPGPLTSDAVVHVFRGRTNPAAGMSFSPFNAATDLAIVSPTPDTSNAFGNAVSSIADQDGDGFRDITIGAFRDRESAEAGPDQGRLYIVSGNNVGTLTLTDSTDYLTKFIGTGALRIGTGLANNAQAIGDADVNGDGIEDLVASSSLGLQVWYGGQIPTGDVTASGSENYLRARPTGFNNGFTQGNPPKLPVTWLRDADGDGLADLVWADWSPTVGSATGLIEILFD